MPGESRCRDGCVHGRKGVTPSPAGPGSINDEKLPFSPPRPWIEVPPMSARIFLDYLLPSVCQRQLRTNFGHPQNFDQITFSANCSAKTNLKLMNTKCFRSWTPWGLTSMDVNQWPEQNKFLKGHCFKKKQICIGMVWRSRTQPGDSESHHPLSKRRRTISFISNSAPR